MEEQEQPSFMQQAESPYKKQNYVPDV